MINNTYLYIIFNNLKQKNKEMKRVSLLQQSQDDKTNHSMVIKKDKAFVEKAIRDVSDEIGETELQLEERMCSKIPVDSYTMELYYKISVLKAKLTSYESFQKEYFA